MRSPVKRVLVAVGMTLVIGVAMALRPAATSGSESVRGHRGLGVSGPARCAAAWPWPPGCSGGVGEIVGMPRQPGDPASLSRADLVYWVGPCAWSA
jgi:hypothetical protein